MAYERVRAAAILFLVVQGLGIVAWWVLLLLFPSFRVQFLAPGAPDATLLAFFVPDVLVYASGSLAAAYGLRQRQRWSWPALCVTAGAAVYVSLYSLALPFLSGGGWLGALMMLPSLVVMPSLVWLLRPEWLR